MKFVRLAISEQILKIEISGFDQKIVYTGVKGKGNLGACLPRNLDSVYFCSFSVHLLYIISGLNPKVRQQQHVF